MGQLLERLVVLAEDGFLHEHQLVRLQLAQQHLGHGLVHPAVEVHADAHVRPHGLAHRGHVGQAALDLVVAVDELQLLGAVHLDGGEAARHGRLRGGGGVGRAVATDPAVDADAVAHLAAQQVGDAHAQGLALDVPQRLVDAGQCAHVDAAAAVEAGAVHHGPVVLDLAGVLADEVIGQLIDHGGDGVGAAFEHRLAPAVDALVGFDFEEAPARRDDEGGEAGDFHEGR